MNKTTNNVSNEHRLENTLSTAIAHKIAMIEYDSRDVVEMQNQFPPPYTVEKTHSYPEKLICSNHSLPQRHNAKISKSKISFDQSNIISNLIIQLNSALLVNKVLNIAVKNNIKVISVSGNSSRLFPRNDCESVDFHYNTRDLIKDYAPTTILLYPINTHKRSKKLIFGIYLLDDQDQFICRQFVEFFHESIAPNGCKKLKLPRTCTEFDQLYGFDD